jgi:hypothetical protein
MKNTKKEKKPYFFEQNFKVEKQEFFGTNNKNTYEKIADKTQKYATQPNKNEK